MKTNERLKKIIEWSQKPKILQRLLKSFLKNTWKAFVGNLWQSIIGTALFGATGAVVFVKAARNALLYMLSWLCVQITIPQVKVQAWGLLVSLPSLYALYRLIRWVRKRNEKHEFVEQNGHYWKYYPRTGFVEETPYCPIHSIKYSDNLDNVDMRGEDADWKTMNCPIEECEKGIPHRYLKDCYQAAKNRVEAILNKECEEL